MTLQRLKAAFICYTALAALSVALLRDKFLMVVLIVLCALAFKSWIAYKKEQQEKDSGNSAGADDRRDDEG